jgi:hypothetical protein
MPAMATVIEDRRMAGLRRRFRGPLVQLGDPDYEDTRRIWNAAIERRPAVIARCTGPDDVVAAVEFARENELLTAVRGGGHNVSGSALCDGGMVIDLSFLRGVAVDPERRRVLVEPGVRLGELDRACQPFGMATPAGINTVTGVAGLTLGGGIGWLMRRYGLTCDNLVAADVVTADGARVRASDDENPSLLWDCGVGAATSASSPRSSSGCTMWGRRSHRVSSSTMPRTRSVFLPRMRSGPLRRRTMSRRSSRCAGCLRSPSTPKRCTAGRCSASPRAIAGHRLGARQHWSRSAVSPRHFSTR